MQLYQGLLCVLICFFFPNLLYLLLGLIFYRFERTHKFGIKCLAMCALVSSRFIAMHCQMNCGQVKCGNWTCSNYSKS